MYRLPVIVFPNVEPLGRQAEMPPNKVVKAAQALDIPVDSHPNQQSHGVVRQETDVDLSNTPLPSIHVSNANMTELKGALDDAVKRVLVKQQFTQSYLHTDVKLALGWASAVVALGSTAWSYRLQFEDTKFVLSVAVASYMFLSALQFLYSYYIEGRVIYVGKRKSLTKRIETEAIQVLSSTSLFGPAPPQQTITTSSSASRPSSPLSPARSPRSESPTFPTLMRRQSILPIPTTVLSSYGPTYSLTLLYTHTTNSGKSLIRKAKIIEGRGVGEFFDSNGGLEESLVDAWVTDLMADVVGDVEMKEE